MESFKKALLKTVLLNTRQTLKNYLETHKDFSEKGLLEKEILETVCLNCLRYSAVDKIIRDRKSRPTV